MSTVQIEHKSYQIPSCDGFTVTEFITAADMNRSVDGTRIYALTGADRGFKLLGFSQVMRICCGERTTDRRQPLSALINQTAASF